MAEADQPATRRKRPWALTFFGVLAIGGLMSMAIIAGKPAELEMPDIVRFLGHFHPLVLHLPIGVFTLIVFQELGTIFGGRGRSSVPPSLFPMFFGVVSAIAAAIAGFLLYHGHRGDYGDNPVVERHLWGGLAFAIAAVFTFMVKAWTDSLAGNPAWYRLLLFGSAAIMGFTSHDGASITHGRDYLTLYAPPPLKKLLGIDLKRPGLVPAKAAADQAVYPDIVAPILERRCVQCHKQGKAKGKLRMDTFDMLVKGGNEGPGLEPGAASKSIIIVRIELREDDEEHMPPEGKPDIEADELAVLKWWIDSGADPKKTLADFQVPAEIKASLAKLSSAQQRRPPESTAVPDDKLKSAVAELSRQFPGTLSFLSPDSPLLTFTAVPLRGQLNDEAFGKLGPVLPHLTAVDLSATQITDKSIATLATATQLRQLRLTQTAVTDAAIESLLKLPSLESINFYGTKVTDAGIARLAALPNLKRLYIWQTPVSPEGLKALQEKLPKCEIIGDDPALSPPATSQ